MAVFLPMLPVVKKFILATLRVPKLMLATRTFGCRSHVGCIRFQASQTVWLGGNSRLHVGLRQVRHRCQHVVEDARYLPTVRVQCPEGPERSMS